MTIEIICNGCDDCMIVRGKVCQALANLNLNAEKYCTEPHNVERRQA